MKITYQDIGDGYAAFLSAAPRGDHESEIVVKLATLRLVKETRDTFRHWDIEFEGRHKGLGDFELTLGEAKRRVARHVVEIVGRDINGADNA